MPTRTNKFIVLIILIAVALVGCSGESEPEPEQVIVDTEEATISPSLLLTATALVAQATNEAYFAAQPTLSPEEIELQRVQQVAYWQELLGFMTPELESRVNDSPPRYTQVDYAGSSHTVVFTFDDFVAGQVMWFRQTDDVIELVETIVFDELFLRFGEFTDRDEDGQPDIVITPVESNGFVNVRMMEIQPDGSIIDDSDSLTTSTLPSNVFDFNDDGVYEILRSGPIDLGSDTVFPCCFTNYYQWNGTEYVDISATLDESYFPSFAMFDERFGDDTCVYPHLAFDVLAAYIALDRIEEGWERIEPRICPDEVSLEVNSQWLISAFYEWVESYLDEE